jgi:hypothetical protein
MFLRVPRARESGRGAQWGALNCHFGRVVPGIIRSVAAGVVVLSACEGTG